MDKNNPFHYLTVKDHSVSGEEFSLIFNQQRDILKTEPQPKAEDLGRYYESEDYISHTDSKRSVFEKAYHFVRNIALRQKISLISRYKKDGNLLDIGTGTGLFVEYAQRHGWNAVGSEPSEAARKIALSRKISVKSNTSAFADSSYDVITMWHVLEHVPDLDSQIGEINRLLKPDGILVVAVPNFKSFDAHYYKENWAAFDVPRHLWHFSKDGIRRIFSESGFKVHAVEPMKFDAFYVSLLSEKIKTGKMNYVAAILNGLKSNSRAAKSGEYSSQIYIISNFQ